MNIQEKIDEITKEAIDLASEINRMQSLLRLLQKSLKGYEKLLENAKALEDAHK